MDPKLNLHDRDPLSPKLRAEIESEAQAIGQHLEGVWLYSPAQDITEQGIILRHMTQETLEVARALLAAGDLRAQGVVEKLEKSLRRM